MRAVKHAYALGDATVTEPDGDDTFEAGEIEIFQHLLIVLNDSGHQIQSRLPDGVTIEIRREWDDDAEGPAVKALRLSQDEARSLQALLAEVNLEVSE